MAVNAGIDDITSGLNQNSAGVKKLKDQLGKGPSQLKDVLAKAGIKEESVKGAGLDKLKTALKENPNLKDNLNKGLKSLKLDSILGNNKEDNEEDDKEEEDGEEEEDESED